MKRNRSVLVAWMLSLYCVIGASVSLINWWLTQVEPPSAPAIVDAVGWNWAMPVLFSIPAALIVARQPRNSVGWLLMLPALLTVSSPDSFGYFATPPTSLTFGYWFLLWMDGWSWIPVIFPILLIPLYFPTGRPPSPRWNWVNWLAIGMGTLLPILAAFVETIGPLNFDWTLPNPIGFIPQEVLDGPFLVFWGAGLITLVSTSVAALLVRYRRAQSVERQQLKWLLYVAAVFVVDYTAQLVLSDIAQFSFVGILANILFVLSVLAFPLAIVVAILRYRLYDIDIIIRRTLQYALITGLLALVYFGSIVLLQTIFGSVTGEQSPVVMVLSTLLIAALFTPLRHRVQAVIDRRFFRQKYDAQQVLAAFALTARDETDLDSLNGELQRVIDQTLQPEGVGIWLRSERNP